MSTTEILFTFAFLFLTAIFALVGDWALRQVDKWREMRLIARRESAMRAAASARHEEFLQHLAHTKASTEPGDDAAVKAATPDSGTVSAPAARGAVASSPLSAVQS